MADKIIIGELELDTSKVIASQQKLASEIETTKKQMKEVAESSGKASKEYIELEANMKALKGEYNSNKNALAKVTQAQNANEGSLAQLKAQLSVVTNEWNNLTEEERLNSERGKQITAQKTKLTEQLTKEEKATGDARRSVGQYENAMNALPSSMKGVVQGAKGAGQALKALAGIPIVLVITGIVAAITGLVKLFKSTDDGGTKLEATMNGLKAVFQVLKGVVLDLVEGTKAKIQLFGKSFELLKAKIAGNDEQVAKIKQEMQELSDVINKNKPFENLGKRAKDAYTEVYNLTFAMDELNDKMISAISEQKEMEFELENYLNLAADQTKSEKERIQLLEAANASAKKLYGQRKKFAEDEFNNLVKQTAAEREVSEELVKWLITADAETVASARKTNEDIAELWNEGGDERIKELEELYVKALDADIQYTTKTKRIVSQLSSLRKKLNKEDADNATEQAARETDEVLAILTNQLDATRALRDQNAEITKEIFKEQNDSIAKTQQELYENMLQARALDAENEWELAQGNIFSQLELDRQYLEQKREQDIAYAKKIGADIEKVNKRYDKAELELERAKINAKMSLAAGFAQDIATIFGKQTAIGKAAAVAQTTITTIQSGVNSFNSLAPIPIVGPALGAVAAAAAVASGYAQIKKILSVKSGLPGENKGASSGGGLAGGGGASPNIPQVPRETVQGSVGSGIVSRESGNNTTQAVATGVAQALQDNPLQPTLVTDNVTVNQDTAKAANETATT